MFQIAARYIVFQHSIFQNEQEEESFLQIGNTHFAQSEADDPVICCLKNIQYRIMLKIPPWVNNPSNRL